MTTRLEAANKLADIILELVIKKDEINNSTIESYRRVINQTTGTPIVTEGVSSQSNIILYGNDYRTSGFAPEFYNKLDLIVDTCLARLDGSYVLPDIDQLGFNQAWHFETQGEHPTYGNDAWIEFSPPDTNDGNTAYGTLCTGYATNLTVTGLRLDTMVLGFLSQFVPFNTTIPNIDPDLANEVLDTNIYELIPGQQTRQQRIDKLFSEFTSLLGPSPIDMVDGQFDIDVNNDNVADTWDELQNSQDYWDGLYGIVPSEDPDSGNIVRLSRHERIGGQSLQSMRNILDNYLKDLDYTASGEFEDTREERESTGKGYLQIRHLNQSIIIRNEEDKDLGIIGSDYNNPDWLERGFTISMWVRFLTQTNEGTLFNFGNPTRTNNPYGFKLETFTVSKDSYTIDGVYDNSGLPPTAFQESDYARFVRLVVHEPDSKYCLGNELILASANGNYGSECYPGTKIRDSHFGSSVSERIPTLRDGVAYHPTEINQQWGHKKYKAFNYTQVPINFNEWFYIVATYNPTIVEDFSHDYCASTSCPDCEDLVESELVMEEACNLNYDKWWWYNHMIPAYAASQGSTQFAKKYVGNSPFGAKCKVEVISKSAMNRALGYL